MAIPSFSLNTPLIIFAEKSGDGAAIRGMIPNIATQCLTDDEKNNILETVYLHPMILPGGYLNKNIPLIINIANDQLTDNSSILFVKLKIVYEGKDKVLSWTLSKKSAVNNQINMQFPFSEILDFIYENYTTGSKNLSYQLFLSVTTRVNETSYCLTISSISAENMAEVESFSAKVIDIIGAPPIDGDSTYSSIDSSNFGYELPFHLEIEPLDVDVSKRPFLNTGLVPYYRSTHVNGLNIVRTCSEAQLRIIKDFFLVSAGLIKTSNVDHGAMKLLDLDNIDLGDGEAYTIFTREEIATVDSASNLTGNTDLYAKNDNVYTSQHDFSDYMFIMALTLKTELSDDERTWYNIPESSSGSRRIIIDFPNLLHDLEPVMSIQDRSVHFSPHANIYQPDIHYPDAVYKTENHNHKRLTDGVALVDCDLHMRLYARKEDGSTINLKTFIFGGTVRTDNLSNILSDHLDSSGANRRFFNYLGGILEDYADELPHPYFCNRPFLLEVGSPFGCRVGPTGDYEYTAFQTITFFHPNPNLDEGNEATHMLMTEFDRTVCEFAHSGKVCSPWRHKMTVSVVCDVPHKLYQGTFHPDSNKFFSCDFSKPEIVFRLIN